MREENERRRMRIEIMIIGRIRIILEQGAEETNEGALDLLLRCRPPRPMLGLSAKTPVDERTTSVCSRRSLTSLS